MTGVTTEAEAREWRPSIEGWSDDILPYMTEIADWLPDGATWVEIGVHSGRSIFYLAEQLIARGKRGVELYAIDWWTGPNFRKQLLHTIVANRFNGVTAEEIDMVKIVSFEGARAAELFDDGQIAGCFIDSDHEEKGMKEHLRAWNPKVRDGGRIGGHDYSAKDWPGVVKAVDGFFDPGDVLHPTRSVWEVRKAP